MLLMNDVHVSKTNIPQFIKNWQEALEICRDMSIYTICIGGDLWQSSSSQSLDVLMAVQRMIRTFVSEENLVIIAEGNHCKVDKNKPEGYSHIFKDTPGVAVVDYWQSYALNEDSSAILTVMSYFEEGESFEEHFQKCKEECFAKYPNAKHILYLHQGIQGGLGAPTEKELPASMFEDFDSVLVGHYHNRKKIKGTNVEYIGASRQHNFGEDEEKGYTILYSDGSTRFIKNQQNDRYVTFSITPKQINDELFDEILQTKADKRYLIKLAITGKSSEVKLIDKQKLMDYGITKIDIDSIESISESSHSGLQTRFDKQGIREEYQEFCSQKEIQDVELGLKYIDKIN